MCPLWLWWRKNWTRFPTTQAAAWTTSIVLPLQTLVIYANQLLFHYNQPSNDFLKLKIVVLPPIDKLFHLAHITICMPSRCKLLSLLSLAQSLYLYIVASQPKERGRANTHTSRSSDYRFMMNMSMPLFHGKWNYMSCCGARDASKSKLKGERKRLLCISFFKY